MCGRERKTMRRFKVVHGSRDVIIHIGGNNIRKKKWKCVVKKRERKHGLQRLY